jgi:hypothetical protein
MKENYSILKAANRATLKKSDNGQQYSLEVTKFDENGLPKTEIIELNLEEIQKELTDAQARVENLTILLTDVNKL